MSEIEYSETIDTAALDEAERQIAAKYMRIVPWGAVAWAFCNLAVWLSLWPLVLFNIMPLWLGFIIASINVALCYLPSHEAQHNIIARRGQPLRWLNELVGHVSVIPWYSPIECYAIPIWSTTPIPTIRSWIPITQCMHQVI